MNDSVFIHEKTEAYHSRVRDVLSSMPTMTSGEFYAQMEKVMGHPKPKNRSLLVDSDDRAKPQQSTEIP